jgi:hypothetical protein
MQPASLATFAADLTQLRQALIDADPLAARPEVDSVAAAADALAAAFTGASTQDRDRFLLRALDDAIAGIEVAAHLADALHGPALLPDTAAASLAEPLRDAYRAFADSQPTYQVLYHYRNALAAQLQLDAHPIPDAVTATQPSGADATAEVTADGAARPRRARKKSGAKS